jgi:chemotaxis protein MotB
MKKLQISSTEEEIETEGTWAISYGDMITLLLSFFVIFFTTDFDKNEKQKLNQHMLTELQAVDFGEPLAREVVGDQVDQIHDLNQQLWKIMGEKKNHSMIADLENLDDSTIPKVEMDIIPWNENLIIKFSKVSFFESGEVDLTEQGEQTLNKFVEKFSKYIGAYTISIKAFTDKKKVRSTNPRFKDNLELSALRAVSAMRHIQKQGVPLSQIDIAGHGELNKIKNYLKNQDQLTQAEINSLSRTVVVIIKPEREESFL